MTEIRWGDYIILINILLNLMAILLYAAQGHWKNAAYWLAVMQINIWVVTMK